MIEFPPYRLDLRAEMLWRDGAPVRLRPKTWAVLRYLAERPGMLVTKDDLVTAVWGQSAVSDDAITRTVGELRRALADDARTPRVVRTVHRKGFRFVAPVVQGRSSGGDARQVLRADWSATRLSFVADGKDAGASEADALRAEWLQLAAQSDNLSSGFQSAAGVGASEALHTLSHRFDLFRNEMRTFLLRLAAYHDRYGRTVGLTAGVLRSRTDRNKLA